LLILRPSSTYFDRYQLEGHEYDIFKSKKSKKQKKTERKLLILIILVILKTLKTISDLVNLNHYFKTLKQTFLWKNKINQTKTEWFILKNALF
jgi:hypothetical protein